jgi:hypothetical protein
MKLDYKKISLMLLPILVAIVLNEFLIKKYGDVQFYTWVSGYGLGFLTKSVIVDLREKKD